MDRRQYYESLLSNENVQRALATIRAAEDTARYPDPYATAFGGGTIADLSWHPGTSRPFTGTTGRRQRTTAAGAYQFLNKTWNNVASALGLEDFSPTNQDVAAVALMDQRGALDNVLEGDVDGFISAANNEWASFPGSPYDQRTRSRGFMNRAWNTADPGMLSAMGVDVPTPEEAPRWNSAVPGEVERAELEGVPGGLIGPAVTPSEGYGMLASTMSQTPSLGLSGAVPADRMASGPVAQGVDGLRAGLLSQQTGGLYADQPQMADMQQRANAMTGLLSYDQAPAQSPAAAAIESIAPSSQAPASSAPSLASAYGQMGQSLYDGGVLGLSGQKLYDPNSLADKLLDPTATASIAETPATPGYVDPSVSVAGPASPTIETPQTQQTAGPTPPADVGSFPAAPSTIGTKAKGLAGTVAGSLLGAAAAGPIGGLLGGVLGKEMMSGKGLFSGQNQAQTIGGLLSSQGAGINNIGSGSRASYSVWGGGTPAGTQATATDGSRITSLGGGLLARTDRNGITTTFNDRGNIVDSSVSNGRGIGGLLSDIGNEIGSAFGGGSSNSGGSPSRPEHAGLW